VSKDHDPTGADKYRISLSDESGQEIESRQFRIAWQSPRKNTIKSMKNEQGTQNIDANKKDSRTRFRIIPSYKDDNGKLHETKFELPVYYLGLSRLFPIGEAKDDSFRPKQMAFTNNEHREWFVETYKKVLYLNEDIETVSEFYYFTTKNHALKIERNSNILGIEGDLMVQSIIQSGRRIPVYAEDNEARWFFKNLASENLGFLSIPDVSLGCGELLRLLSGDAQYFGNVIMLFDGDVTDENIKSNNIAQRTKNVIKLLGNKRPEQVMFEYIMGLTDGHPFLEAGKVAQFSLAYFERRGPNYYPGNERSQYKSWFQEHQQLFDMLNLYSFWAADNQAEVDNFKADFRNAYNTIAARLSLPQIS
jgi:hypothetical protein